MNEKTFVSGLFYKKPHEKAPEFVIGTLSAKREEFITFLQDQPGEWVNMVIKESKGGKTYVQIDDWKPKEKPATVEDAKKVFDEPSPF